MGAVVIKKACSEVEKVNDDYKSELANHPIKRFLLDIISSFLIGSCLFLWPIYAGIGLKRLREGKTND